MNLNIILFIIIAYILVSAIFRKLSFLLFDVIWRVLIIVALYFILQERLPISQAQWVMLGALFIVGFITVLFFSPYKSLHNHLISVCLAPLFEEFVFRGLLLQYVQGTDFMRVTIISIFFGLYHVKNIQTLTLFSVIYQVIYAVLIGFPLGFLALKTNSLFLPIALHAVNNILAATVTMRRFPKIIKYKE